MSADFIAVDWGTTRLRAFLMQADGVVLAQASTAQGVQSVAAGGFAAALRACCAPWIGTLPRLPIFMAGMVGSRNGWVEAHYVRTPCALPDLAAACVRLEMDGHDVALVPGVDHRAPDGFYDVMRGEETQVLGAGLRDGVLCLPGTHSKWVEVSAGRITRFATFITGEAYAAMSTSFIARLASAPAQDTHFPGEAGQEAMASVAGQRGGLLRALFQVRARVLAGDMAGAAVLPFLSHLLVADEVAHACAMFGGASVHLVASAPHLALYAHALQQGGIKFTSVDPDTAFVRGVQALFASGWERA